MTHPLSARAAMLAVVGLAAGWVPVSSLSAGEATTGRASIRICHGFGCHFRSELDLASGDEKRLAAMLSAGASSPRAERVAVSKAVQYYENRAVRVIGVRDQGKSTAKQLGKRGQMDCIDESTNTRAFLLHLERRGLLKHHTVNRNVTRGFLIDGRYPHSTAVLREKSGTKWAVDSWYEPTGGPPDIMPLSEWLKRGVMGVR
ncbi:hypothetical protein [Pseudaminobacter sp. NGMCC 1.201702]|uniref:hypothetical protein n=1 Tax=Pseudaminobacter sp. NGMCC 1.201702 TaxID=3391825 RepID=UPI0039F104E3